MTACYSASPWSHKGCRKHCATHSYVYDSSMDAFASHAVGASLRIKQHMCQSCLRAGL